MKIQNILGRSLVTSLGLFALAATAPAVVVNEGDIVGNSYTYSNFSFDNMNDVRVVATLSGFSNMNSQFGDGSEGSLRWISNTEATATATFLFDFSQTSYFVQSLSLLDTFHADSRGWPGSPTATITYQLSTDGVNWDNGRVYNLGAESYINSEEGSPMDYTFATPTQTVYYRLNYESAVDYSILKYTFVQNEGVNSVNSFNATFTVVPEPSTVALFILAGLGLLILKRRNSASNLA